MDKVIEARNAERIGRKSQNFSKLQKKYQGTVKEYAVGFPIFQMSPDGSYIR
jgi:hypothetical protein